MNTSWTVLRQVRIRRGLVFGMIIMTALFAFEMFNYSTTEYALSDLLGELDFAGLRWATILAIAFCGIDFAGIARLFTPTLNNNSDSGMNESWYLFGAWLLAATMNAMLTWWGVSLAVMGHQTLGNDVVSRATLLRVVPIFVSVLVWLIRVLIIGTFSVAGDRLFIQDQDELRVLTRTQPQPRPRAFPDPAPKPRTPALRSANSSSVARTATRSAASNNHNQPEVYPGSRPEPTYHSLAASSGSNPNTNRPAAPARPGGQFRSNEFRDKGR